MTISNSQRVRTPAARREPPIQAFERSGLSGAKFAALHGRSPCQAYYQNQSPPFPKRQRITIFQSILSAASATINPMKEPDRRDLNAAWRHAAVRWLVCQNLLSLSHINPRVTPFPQNVAP
jgi:hypothetical protein